MNVIGSNVRIGDNFEIGHFNVIEDNVYIGDDVKIGNFVYLAKGTKIGNRVFIDSYVRSSGKNNIGDDAVIRYGATIAKRVFVGNHVFISPNVMTIYSDHKTLKIQTPKTVIRDKVYIGTAAVINKNVEIETGSIIGAMSYVHKSIKKKGIYVGVPAKLIGDKNE